MSGVGKKIGEGHLRVDAAKAVAKLRDYQLPDPLQWLLECFRGAVGLGATHVVAWGDADDVWLAWRGPAPDPEELAKLLDVLVSPQTKSDRRWARLFAIGVNTALGLAPRFVDLWSLGAPTDDDAGARRVRFSPGLLANEGEGLRALAPEKATPPAELVRALAAAKGGPVAEDGTNDGANDADVIGGAVQMRRAFGTEVMGRWLWGGDQPELDRLRRATRDSRVAVTIGGRAREATKDVVRLPLGPGFEGFVAITAEPGSQLGITLDVAERGAVLQELVMQLPGLEAPRGRLPVRVYVDAERLPTNAARSAVRLDERPLSELAPRVEAILPKLLEALAERAVVAGPSVDDEARTAALRLLAAGCAGPSWSMDARALPALLAPLAKLPIVRDAVGRARSVDSFSHENAVHTGREPYDVALAPWLGEILFCPPGDAAQLLLADAQLGGAELRAKEARRHLAIRQAWLAHPTREPRVEPAPGQLLALRFGSDAGAPRGSQLGRFLNQPHVRGELALLDPSTLGAKRAAVGELHVLLEGRPIGVAQLEAPWPWVAVVEGTFVAQPDYRGIVIDTSYEGAVNAARAAAIEAVELLAHALLRPNDDWPKQATPRHADLAAVLAPPADAREARGAPFSHEAIARFRQTQSAFVSLLDAQNAATIAQLFKTSALARLPLWPIDDGVSEPVWTPLRKLLDDAPRDGEERALRLRVLDGAPTRRALPRPAAVVGAHDGPILGRLFPTVEWVPYDTTRGEAITTKRLAQRFAMPSEVCALVEREDEGRRGVVALTQREPELTLYHRGLRLERRPFQPRLLPCRIAVDDDRIVPSANGTAVIADSPVPFDPDVWERALLDALIDDLGDQPSALVDGERLVVEALDWVREALLIAVAKRGLASLDADRRAKLEAYPLIPRAHATPLSLDDLRAERGMLSWVPRDARVDRDLEWHPIVASEEAAKRIAQLVERRPNDGRAELERRRREVDRKRREEIVRSGAVMSVPPADDEWVALTGNVAKAATHGVVRLARGHFQRALRIDLRVEGHAYRIVDVDAPVGLEAIVDVPMDALGSDRAGLTAEAQTEITNACERALGAILVNVGTKSPERLLGDPSVAKALDAWVSGGVRKGSKIAAKLCAIPAFPTVQGGRASIDEASTHSRVRIAHHVGAWLGPIDDDDGHTLDKPVLAVPEDGSLQRLLEALAAPKGLLDHTRAVRTLQAERRVRQGVVSAPTLPEIPKALKSSVRDLSPRKRIPSPLGPGELGLLERGPAQAGVFANGGLVGWLPIGVVPPIRAAMEIPALAEDAKKMPASTGDRLSTPLRSLTGRLLREQVIPALDAHPTWVRIAVRRALGAGVLEAKDVEDVELFETTDDRWVTTKALFDQANTYGDVWYTTRASAADRSRRALDEGRLVLRLEPDEPAGLLNVVVLFDAAERLQREDLARQNLARPRVTELYFSTRVRPHLVGDGKYGRGKKHGVVGLLAEPSDLVGIHLFREGLPLGTTPLTAFDWPLVALAESDKLTPNDVYDAVIDDTALAAVRRSVGEAAEAALDALLGEPTLRVVRTTKLTSRHSSTLGGPGAVRGVVGLSDRLGPGTVEVKIAGRPESFQPDVQPPRGGPRRAMPIDGVVLAALPTHQLPLPRVNAALRVAYAELVKGLVAELREGTKPDDVLLAHVVRGVALGVYAPEPVDASIVVPCFHPKPLTLPQLRDLLARDDAFPVRAPGKLPKQLVALLADGTRTSEQVELALGDRARRPAAEAMVTEKAVEAEHAAADVTSVGASPEAQAEVAHAEWSPDDAPPREEPEPSESTSTTKARATKPEAAKAHALAPLAEHLLAQLASLGLPERIAHVRIDDAQKALVRYRAEERTLVLSGTHASLVALQAARLSRSPDAERAMRVLVAHVMGVLDRASAAVTEATQLGAFGALLSS
jgi:hypothetical protein